MATRNRIASIIIEVKKFLKIIESDDFKVHSGIKYFSTFMQTDIPCTLCQNLYRLTNSRRAQIATVRIRL